MSDYGPQHEQIVAMIERTRTLTEEEIAALDDAWYVSLWNATMPPAREASRAARRGGARESAWESAWEAAEHSRWRADAVCALVLRDLIGQYGFTQDHYDLLTGAWRTAIGAIHPDDKDLS